VATGHADHVHVVAPDELVEDAQRCDGGTTRDVVPALLERVGDAEWGHPPIMPVAITFAR
jgi:hypothetical protein